MAEAGEIQVRVLMFPLDSHPGAREQCVSVICDEKSFHELHEGYTSDNQCEEGTKIVDDTIAFLKEKGISSTPTYIFADGLFQPGLLQADQLRTRLGIQAPEAVQTP
jgi:thiol:disulfide interchange protein DsbC